MSNESIYKPTMPFIPVTTTDARVHQTDILNGCVYFATDSGKIYLDMNDERTSLGGSGAAVLYSTASIILKDTEGNYLINADDLDDDGASPKRDDLIINADGRFFRVNYYNDNSGDINCVLIAVSGTGGGGGGGDSSTPVVDPKVINVEYFDVEYSFLNGRPYYISFIATAQKDKNLNVSWEVYSNKSNTTPIDTGSTMIQSGSLVDLEVGRKITPEGGYHRVSISITGANSYPYSQDFNKIRCIDLKIENDPNSFNNHNIFSENFDFWAKVYGQVAKTLNIAIDGVQRASKSLTDKDNDRSINITIRCNEWGLLPGAHTLKAWLEADGVPSNELLIDFIYHPEGTEDTTYVLISNYPTEVWSYESPAITYWAYNTALDPQAKNTIRLLVNGVEQATVTYPQELNDKGLIWNATGLIPDANNICSVQSGGVSRDITIYCRKSDIFDEVTGSSYLLLNAEGRSNDVSLEKRLVWEYKNNYNRTIKASLLNFNWDNNGWMKDKKTGRNCLRVSNGASVEIPLGNLFDKGAKPTEGGYTFEFEFKPYNLYSYNLLTQSTETVEGTTNEDDDEVTVNREFDASLAAISYIGVGEDGKAVGMCCGTQDAFFRMSDGKNVSVRYMENNIVNVTATIDAAKSQILMYVNGVASGMTGYSSATASLPIDAAKIVINSEQCDLDLYTVRVYRAALPSHSVVQNFIASKKDLDIYNQNKFAAGAIVDLGELKDYNTDNPDNATIPYIIFKTKSPDILPYNKANADVVCDIEFVNPALDYALSLGDIDEDYYKKHCPSFLAKGVTLNVQGTSSQKYPRKNFKGKFKKAIQNETFNCTNPNIVDKKLSKFYMNDNIAEKTFTWKADYMDSSSCHNTGFASYAQDLYWNHPLDYYEGTAVNAFQSSDASGTYHNKFRTSLFGFPVLAFHEKSDGTTEFIGRYNFNLDKGADDTLGMAWDKKHPYVEGKYIEDDKEYDLDYAHICECWEMANNMGGRCSFRGNPFDANYNYTDKKYWTKDPNGVTVEGHSDLGDDLEVRYHINGDAIEGAWVNRDLPEDDGGVYIGSEAAFNVLLGGNADGTGRTGAYTHLERFFKWLQSCFYAFDLDNSEDFAWAQSLVNQRAQFETANGFFENIAEKIPQYRAAKAELDAMNVESKNYSTKLNEVNVLAHAIIEAGILIKDTHYQIDVKSKTADGVTTYFNITNITSTDEEIQTILNTRKAGVDENYQIHTNAEGKYYNDDKSPVDVFYRLVREDRKYKFENEFDKHLNKEYCMIYYIMTELLLQFDSRGKNMMFSSWGPVEKDGEYIWFPIFYDIDTQLGVNNSGIPSWEYNVEPTTGFNNAGGAKAFSTSNSLLWMNFHASFVEDRPDEIRSAYRALRESGKLDIAKINGYYNFDYDISKDYCMKGILPINVMNANQDYKYIQPAEKGYIIGIDATGAPKYRTTSAYYYCLQGSRDLHRAQFLRNRFNYYDSKWMAQAYNPGATGGTDLFWRANAHNFDKDSLDSNLLFHIKPALDQYLVLWLDDFGTNVHPIFVKGGQIAEIDLKKYMTNSTSYTQQIVHIGGPEYIQEYGNVSLLYPDEFEYTYPAVTKIEMGNEDSDYVPNPNYKTAALADATKDKPLLKVFDITNLSGMTEEITTLDLTSSVKLETFKALGTKLSNVVFASGVNLKRLYLPATLSELHLNAAPNLNKIVYDENDIHIPLEDGTIIDAECMFIKDIVLNDEEGNPKSTIISNIDINGGNLNLYSYELLLKLTQAKLKMKEEGNNSKLGIQMKEVRWTPYTQIGEGAIYDESKNYKYATNNFSYRDYIYNKDTWNQDVLSGRVYVYEESELASPTSLTELVDVYITDNANIFINDIYASPALMPILTGDLYIDNEVAISEAKLANEYNKIFPGLTIRAKKIENADRARFVHTYTDVEQEIEVQRFEKNAENKVIVAPAITSIPNPVYYKFYGWTTEKPINKPYINEGVVDSDKIIKANDEDEFDFSAYTFDEVEEHTFYAIYQRDEFTIEYFDLIGTERIPIDATTLTYGEALTESTRIPHRDESSLAFNKCYRFKGWTQNIDKCGILTTQTQVDNVIEPDFAALTASQNYVFYAVYLEEDALTIPSSEKYFNFNEINSPILGIGYRISIKEEYRKWLSGKVTLPAKFNGVDIVAVGDFADTEKITHVFFETGSAYQSIGEKAFYSSNTYGSDTLMGVYMPNSIKHIQNQAFYRQQKLSDIAIDDNMKVTSQLPASLLTIGDNAFAADVNTQCSFKISSMPDEVTSIGSGAFNKGGSNITIHTLPSKITTIKSYTFAYCQNVIIDEIGSNNDTPFTIGTGAFLQLPSNAGDNRTQVACITLGSNVNRIEKDAFANYGPRESDGGLVAYSSRPYKEFEYVSGSTADNRGGDTGLADIAPMR